MKTPGRHWRDMLRQSGFRGFRPEADQDIDRQFRRYVDRLYDEQRTRLQKLRRSGKDASSLETSVFVLAVAALSGGRLAAAYDVIDFRQPPGSHLWPFSQCLQALLPLPKALDAHANHEQIRDWLKTNAPNLTWSEAHDCFIWMQDASKDS